LPTKKPADGGFFNFHAHKLKINCYKIKGVLP